MAKTKKPDKEELLRIRRKLNDGRSYGRLVEEVFTWDVAEIFTDFRAVVQIARRALKESNGKDRSSGRI